MVRPTPKPKRRERLLLRSWFDAPEALNLNEPEEEGGGEITSAATRDRDFSHLPGTVLVKAAGYNRYKYPSSLPYNIPFLPLLQFRTSQENNFKNGLPRTPGSLLRPLRPKALVPSLLAHSLCTQLQAHPLRMRQALLPRHQARLPQTSWT